MEGLPLEVTHTFAINDEAHEGSCGRGGHERARIRQGRGVGKVESKGGAAGAGRQDGEGLSLKKRWTETEVRSEQLMKAVAYLSSTPNMI